MRWVDWHPIYLDIVERLNLDSDADREATDLLTSILESINPDPLLKRLSDSISGSRVIVCGAGPSLKQHMESLLKRDSLTESVVVVADGATSVILNLVYIVMWS